jgi:hypothetical protein
MRTAILSFLLFIAVFLQSCFKEEEMVTPHPMGELQTATIPMTETYLNQVYFSLDSGKIVSTIVKTTYDLGFECSKTGWHIILNTSNFMKAADLGLVPFGQAYDTTGLKMLFDKSDGNGDSTAVGEWFVVSGKDTISNNHVYAISRGLDELGNPLGLYQLIVDSLKNSTYYFRYAPLSGGTGVSGSVIKNQQLNYLFFSFKTGAVVPVEPPKQTYDLLFTQYTTLLFTDEGEAYPYLVTGVLLNRYLAEVATDSTTDFLAITREKARMMTFRKSMDGIGWEWKIYDFESGFYTIRPNLSYVIRGNSGYYFKLRFVGFYNKDGLKGYPVMEYQLL